jgi:hypothetical protein
MGSILGADGCVIYFDEKALDGSDFRVLSVRDWVECEERSWGERVRAVKVRPIASPIMGGGASRT